MRINVRVKPNSRHVESIEQLDDGSYEIRVKAPAVGGRANIAVKQMIASFFAVTKSQVRLIRGAASKYKVFDVKDKVKS